MPLVVDSATEHEVQAIGEVHMRAFADNAMLHAQFPTPAARVGLKQSVSQKAADEIKNDHGVVLVVRDTELDNKVIGYAEWALPTSTAENEPDWIWPEGTRLDILDKWVAEVERVKDLTLGDQPCYRLAFLGTDPDHERRGAATMLIKPMLERSQKEGVPAYLESTPNAARLYQRFGFKPQERIYMAFEDGSSYEEVGYLFEVEA